MSGFDPRKPHGTVSGIAAHKYEQDGRYFTHDGKEVFYDENWNVIDPNAKKPAAPKTVDPPADTSGLPRLDKPISEMTADELLQEKQRLTGKGFRRGQKEDEMRDMVTKLRMEEDGAA